ncbi:DUF1501 domain-containing protein [Shimia thalassica]|uniref:DUF1501 domain-containing protein n=1 Tax=Shimia thalassica TaxID=1715693 RepID=UPI002734F3F8|nr:DUF1501 domain-containing protein [Shimia thalassica]MDP2579348.1 DUF1501 domain-containing protein [Shimia thalassica]
MAQNLTRRSFLARTAAIGCSAAASPLLTPVSFAAGPWDNRLVVIILRGGLDGLDAVRPWGDPEFALARPRLATDHNGAHDLNGFYGMNPALAPLMPLWQAGELGFAHAVSQPYREKRSHFDGQDLLEAGIPTLKDGIKDGWLNRMLQDIPGVRADTAFSIGSENMLLAQGAAPVSSWSPDVDVTMSAQGVRLLELTMKTDPALAEAMAQALVLADSDGDGVVPDGSDDDMMAMMQSNMKPQNARKSHLRIADFAAAQLVADTRIVSFSLGGWDTHANQTARIKGPLSNLADVLLRLKEGCGPSVWGRTTVVAMTEFGRTVRENGTKGTDHGTGGVMIMAGGALRGGQVFGQWPGLAEADLYDRRDLMPLDDVRRYAGWAIRSSFGLDRAQLENHIFPGIELGDDPNMLL